MRIGTLFLLVLVVSINAFAQKSKRSSRYLNAYKMYEHAEYPIAQDTIKNFVYFARDREAIIGHPLLENSRFQGAQIMYAWKQLEPSKDHYDFSVINDDYNYLRSKGKKLFIQLQDATFSPKYRAVPGYLQSEQYDGGEIPQVGDNGEPEGFIAKRWNKSVQVRFARLLMALGKAFDGKIEGINLQETAIGMSHKYDTTFTPEIYVESIKAGMRALKNAFPTSTTIQYANFMPGEWLPWDDKGYLKSIYEYGEQIGVGLGAPDLMVQKKPQLNHALAMMHEYRYSVPLGIAVQDGNYIGQTATMEVIKDHKNIVPLLHAFAKDFLKVNYMFWSNQEPYFQQDVLPCFISE
jgi:hypothetical protein